MEHLLSYGADMDGHNASGNTPLHVCAVNNQEACARMLLFRGAQRSALNYANQTPYQVNFGDRFFLVGHFYEVGGFFGDFFVCDFYLKLSCWE